MAMDRHHSSCVASPRDLPALSPTFQTAPLLTPGGSPSRCTIDTAHYRQYLLRSLQMDPPNHNAVHVRTQLYGDNQFLTHKYTEIHQPYIRTTLQLSDMRQTDDIVAKPLKILHSEIGAPFPAQHPYTSHISKFAVFPATEPGLPHDVVAGGANPLSSLATTPPVVNSSTQTQPSDLGYLVPRPTAPFYVLKKASESQVRVECHHLRGMSDGVRGDRDTLWDLPRSQRHMRATTYPAPIVQCPVRPSSLSLGSREALRSIYHQVMLSTSYSDHFSPPKRVASHTTPVPRSGNNQPCLPAIGVPRPPSSYKLGPPIEDLHSMCQCEGCGHSEGCGQCERCVQSEGCGQYVSDDDEPAKGGDHMTPSSRGGGGSLGGGVQTPGGGARLAGGAQDASPPAQVADSAQTCLSWRTKDPFGETSTRQDKATQTEQEADSLPLLVPQKVETYPEVGQSRRLPSLYPDPSCTEAPPYTPRSTLVAQRMVSLLRFSKSEARRRFHSLYPEGAPNLREHKTHSENERRHVINGYNAYYYH